MKKRFTGVLMLSILCHVYAAEDLIVKSQLVSPKMAGVVSAIILLKKAIPHMKRSSYQKKAEKIAHEVVSAGLQSREQEIIMEYAETTVADAHKLTGGKVPMTGVLFISDERLSKIPKKNIYAPRFIDTFEDLVSDYAAIIVDPFDTWSSLMKKIQSSVKPGRTIRTIPALLRERVQSDNTCCYDWCRSLMQLGDYSGGHCHGYWKLP